VAGSVEPATLSIISESTEQTDALGRRLGALLRPGDLVLLMGDLGSGKTHLAKGIVAGLGSADLVTSPSFVLVNEYQAPAATVYHADLYRIDNPDELLGIGLEEAWSGPNISLVEWAERAGARLPPAHLAIHLRHLGDTTREIDLEAHGRRYEALLEGLSIKD
jgi:tRNA threonylcarbamoyladenosine biosynthesis protein TsaE